MLHGLSLIVCIAVTNSLGDGTYIAFDVQGRQLATWGATYPVAYEYDDYNRMVAMYTLRSTNILLASFADFCSNLSAFDKTVWKYDLATGLLTNKLYANTNGPSYTYTSDGRLATRTWARGLTTTYRYDLASGAMTNIDYSDSTPDVYFTLDRVGRQKTITDGTGVRNFTYNDALQLASETNVMATITRQYDSLGRSAGFELWNGGTRSVASSYGYSDLGRFSSVSSSVYSASSVVNYAYLSGSDLLQGWSNGIVSTVKSYEPNRDLLTQVKNTSGTNVISQFDYQNDVLGRRTLRVDNSAVTNNFGYNSKSELTAAAMGTNAFGYNYDPIGNRTSATNNGATTTYQANLLNQYTNIVGAGAAVPKFDADGNLTNSASLTFTWDAENRLTSVISNGTTIASFKYDYMSRRYQKVAGAVTNTFTYDGWNLISEANTTKTNLFVWGLDLSGSLQGAGGIGGLLASYSSSTSRPAYFAVADGNGNITDLVSTNATSLAHYEYDPYGNTIVKSGVMADANPFRFSSKYYDSETGLYYYGYRYYDPVSGRFLGRDPIEEQGGANLYGFCENSPVVLVDSLGEKVIVSPAGAVGEVVALFNFVSDLPAWAEGSEIKSCCNTRTWVPRYVNGYNCLCNALSSPETYTINVETVGSKNWDMKYAAGGATATETVAGPNTWPRTSADNRNVYIPSSSSSTYAFGCFDSGGNYFDAPLWRILAHEFCGHAVSGIGYPQTEISGDREHHNDTIDIENQIASEHGATLRGKYANQNQGESAWRFGKSVYYRNKPRITPVRATDYKLVMP